MENAIYLLSTTVLNFVLRVWLKDKKDYIVDNAIDVANLASKFGLNSLQRKRLNNNIGKYELLIAEPLEDAGFFKKIEPERAKAIIQQVEEDVKNFTLENKDIYELILSNRDLKPLISAQSTKERKLWSEAEDGAYNNCVRYVSDTIVTMISQSLEFGNQSMILLYGRENQLFEELQKELKNIIDLIQSGQQSRLDTKEFQTDYLRSVERKYKKVELFGSDISDRHITRYDISTSYVELACYNDDNYADLSVDDLEDFSNEKSNTIAISQIFERNNIVWLSGEAGSGKTTYIQWLAISAANNTKKVDGVESLIPIVLKLRNVDFPINLRSEIEKIVDSHCPDKWIDYLYSCDKMLLLFDGVDEISKDNRRQLFDFIEDIAERWSFKPNHKSKMVITSRLDVDDLLDIKHSKIQILPMNDKTIKTFVYYWHRTIMSDSTNDMSKIDSIADKVISTILESKEIKSIASTPLLCAMICSLSYTSYGNIPTNKSELYQKCCSMLVHFRDKERQVKSIAQFDDLDYTKKSRILENIALYMMRSESVQMDKEQVVAHLSSFLLNSTLIKSEDIRKNPTLLLDYLIARTGLIREPSYKKIEFIHKTFLEYYASEAIYRAHEWETIPATSNNPFWKETIIMCIAQMDRENATSIIKKIHEKYKVKKDAEYVFIASLCAKNANDIDSRLEEQIRMDLRKLIPPISKNIRKLTKAGEFILPFLGDATEYSNKQRINCLRLLDNIIQNGYGEESDIIPIAISYLRGEGDYNVIERACEILSLFDREILKIYDIPRILNETIIQKLISNDNEAILSDLMLSMLDNIIVPEFEKIEELRLYMIDIEKRAEVSEKVICELYNNNIYNSLGNIKRIKLYGVTTKEHLSVLSHIKNLIELHLYVDSDKDILLDKLNKFQCFANLEVFELGSNEEINYYENDLRFAKNISSLILNIPQNSFTEDALKYICCENLVKLKKIELRSVEYNYKGSVAEFIELINYVDNADYMDYSSVLDYL